VIIRGNRNESKRLVTSGYDRLRAPSPDSEAP
jgi:hypothetical protein